METKTYSIVTQTCTLNELNDEIKQLIECAKQACHSSYAPYSQFNVGASVLLQNGIIVSGNNQENIAYPSGLCAERVALFYANAQHPDQSVKAIAIAAYTKDEFTEIPISPCGSCRQALLEAENRFDQHIVCYLYGKNNVTIFQKIKDLLPFCFEFEGLKVK
jgi:cytidine deaminase